MNIQLKPDEISALLRRQMQMVDRPVDVAEVGTVLSVGDGIALPHVRNPAILGVNAPAVALGFLDNPIDFGALDGRKVRVIFLPQPVNIRQHLHLLARISFALRDDHFRRLLDKRAPAEDILAAARAL